MPRIVIIAVSQIARVKSSVLPVKSGKIESTCLSFAQPISMEFMFHRVEPQTVSLFLCIA